MSSSTPHRKLSDAILEAIVELAQARPHTRKRASFTPAEWQIYWEGYYTGVMMALRVADLAIGRWHSARALLRRERRAQKSA